MSGAPADAAERLRALDPATSFIVQAPAGSGKTELLTRRVLALLARVDAPEEVLAITFTRQAAAEMRHRVVTVLARAASGEPGRDAYEEEGLALARAVLRRDAELGWCLLDDPGRLGMRTIDSLATRLAHRLPVVSALGAAIATVDDPRALHLEAAERFLEHHLETIDLVCLRRDNKLDQVRDLCADLLAVRDQWRGYVMEDLGDASLRTLLQSMLDDLVSSRLAAAALFAPDDLAPRSGPMARRAAGFLARRAELDGTALDEAEARIVAWAERADALPGGDASALGDWLALADFLLTKGGTVRKAPDKSTGFPAQTDAAKYATTKPVLRDHKNDLVALLAELDDEPEFVARLAETRTLGGLAYGDEDWTLLEQLAGGLRVLLGELQLVFATRREVDFIEISTRARQALGDDGAPTDLALAMDLRLRHLLVDEFQDTSHAQFALFERLVAGWDDGQERTFFAVGDPMQSIYRFREGDVALFLRAIEEGIGPVELEYLRLGVNFRSSPAVIDWINAGFGPAFPQVPDRDIGAVAYEPSFAHLDGHGGVEVHALARGEDGEHEAREAERVADLVVAELAEDPTRSVGVLVRARAHAVPVVAALQARGVRFRAVELDRLGDRPVVRDLVALAHALCFPHDRLSWLTLLRGPTCGLRLTDLHALVDASEQAPLMELLVDPARRAALSADGERRAARFVECVASAVERAPREAVMPWVEAAWLRLGGPAACRDAVDLGAAERCIARLAELERDGVLRQRQSVSAAMARLFAGEGVDADVRVSLMTLHKSKGLEFDAVVLPSIARAGQADRPRLMEWYRTSVDGAPGLLLAPIDRTGAPSATRNPVGRLLQRFRNRAGEAERLRLFYVACTRARSRLHLVATLATDDGGRAKKPAAGSLLAPLWDAVAPWCEVPEPCGPTHDDDSFDGLGPDAAPDEPVAPPLVRVVSDWTPPAFERFAWAVRPLEGPDAVVVDREWQGTTARDVGTVVHRALQRLALAPPVERRVPNSADVERLEREMRTLGVAEALLDETVGQVVEAVRNTLSDPRGRWILDGAHTEPRCEWALTVPRFSPDGEYVGARSLIIDRTFVDADGVRWIVDYKTGAHEGGDAETFLDRELERYREQLDVYVRTLEAMDARPVRAGLWFPLVRGWREHVPTPATRTSVV